MRDEKMIPKVWITKYALTKGIAVEENAKQCFPTVPDGSMIDVKSGACRDYFHKPDWHTTEADAKRQVLKMIEAKRKSIAKQKIALDRLAESMK